MNCGAISAEWSSVINGIAVFHSFLVQAERECVRTTTRGSCSLPTGVIKIFLRKTATYTDGKDRDLVDYENDFNTVGQNTNSTKNTVGQKYFRGLLWTGLGGHIRDSHWAYWFSCLYGHSSNSK